MYKTPNTDLASAMLAEGFTADADIKQMDGDIVLWCFPDSDDLQDFIKEYNTPNSDASRYSNFAQKRRMLIRLINNR